MTNFGFYYFVIAGRTSERRDRHDVSRKRHRSRSPSSSPQPTLSGKDRDREHDLESKSRKQNKENRGNKLVFVKELKHEWIQTQEALT